MAAQQWMPAYTAPPPATPFTVGQRVYGTHEAGIVLATRKNPNSPYRTLTVRCDRIGTWKILDCWLHATREAAEAQCQLLYGKPLAYPAD